MALPTLTPETRAAALEKAARLRQERAAVKARLKSSTGSRADEIRRLLGEVDESEAVARLKVSAMLESLPGIGKVKAAQIMEEIGISPSRKMRGLGRHQAQKLLDHFAD
ncbi:30S ribosomal protein S13 [Helcobacillus massiliensis]|uniref:Transposase n=1 Tax=Helcobacillus massiliensis TaxID=521392 RepID=A0A839QU76_9MICO|nr:MULTISPECIES: integration host factor, actinobacterial type [Helcobacillus]MBB3022330.1 transposase [Helcobacillus massiliensis]MCG7426450.1 30S ribosomal protein S13 [Helcobacillus sp. ACRRO]MCT1556969.1 30S ribosomal protein S13 [Helcobacillus massiliensis]MCT2035358.1 30S ribosomal protein S13 [Helcobacillus massiliensis]MCT2331427.1 30S ribosomal protein S13 [Helcobacillus massiliensis]